MVIANNTEKMRIVLTYMHKMMNIIMVYTNKQRIYSLLCQIWDE